MSELAVVGREEILVGFQLAGVSNVFKLNPGKDAEKEILNILKIENLGIIALDDAIMNSLPKYLQSKLNKSVNPVVVVLSKSAESSNLREDIIRAVGVDLMK